MAFDQGVSRFPADLVIVIAASHKAVNFCTLNSLRAPGDRLRNRAGSRKVKKLMLERRIPIRQREVMPVLVDARGEVLWVPGVARSTSTETKVGTPSLRVRILT